jgi:NAD(P) transhydrogenase subunit alpha
MDPQLVEGAKKLAEQSGDLAANAQLFAAKMAEVAAEQGGHGNFVSFLTVFVLAVFVGYYVVWRVTPALHSPLMAVTNAISSVIIVGALLAAGSDGWGASKLFGFLAVILASVNIFGGFIVTERMLAMFKKKEPK